MPVTVQQMEKMEIGQTIQLPDTKLTTNRSVTKRTMINGKPRWEHYFTMRGAKYGSGVESIRATSAAKWCNGSK